MTIVDSSRPIVGGVDTHLDTHVAAALDANGGVLGVESFATNPVGFVALHEWMCGFGPVARVGIEGTGAYGAGLSRYLQSCGLVVIEVDRTNRQLRRMQGKSDPVDAIEAARAALSGRASGIAKTGDGNVEAIRALLVAQRSGRQARARCLNQIRHLASPAPTACGNSSETSPKPTSRSGLRLCALERTVTRSCTPRNSRCGPSADARSRSATTCTTSTRSSRGSSRRPHPRCSPVTASVSTPPRPCWSPPATTPNGSATKPRGRTYAASHPSTHPQANIAGTDSAAPGTVKRTMHCGGSCSPAWATTPAPAPTSSVAAKKASPNPRSCAS